MGGGEEAGFVIKGGFKPAGNPPEEREEEEHEEKKKKKRSDNDDTDIRGSEGPSCVKRVVYNCVMCM